MIMTIMIFLKRELNFFMELTFKMSLLELNNEPSLGGLTSASLGR